MTDHNQDFSDYFSRNIEKAQQRQSDDDVLFELIARGLAIIFLVAFVLIAAVVL